MPSTNTTITSTLQSLDDARTVLSGAYDALVSDQSAVPDPADILDAATSVAAVSEQLLKVNSLLVGRAVADPPR